MTTYQNYKQQVNLLLRVLPEVGREKDLALHGGTAINFFDKNMPRLSVDIDLTYLPIENRTDSISHINASLSKLKQVIGFKFPTFRVNHRKEALKLLINDGSATVKVEVNNIKRGCFASPVYRPLCQRVQQEFKTFAEIQLVEKGHLYGGKICAALDRQHPRDLFDIKQMLSEDGFTDGIKKGFLFYLGSSNRPIEEMIFPHLKNQKPAFENQFKGMTELPFTYKEFEDTRIHLIKTIHQSLNDENKQFLIQLENGTPDWEIYDFHQFPAIQWKLLNIKKLKENNPAKHKDILNGLQTKLERL